MLVSVDVDVTSSIRILRLNLVHHGTAVTSKLMIKIQFTGQTIRNYNKDMSKDIGKEKQQQLIITDLKLCYYSIAFLLAKI